MAQMTHEEIFDDLSTVLGELLEDWEYSGELTLDTSMMNDLEFESIDAVALGEALEDHYQQVLPFAQFLTKLGEQGVKDFFVSDLVTFLQQNVGKQV